MAWNAIDLLEDECPGHIGWLTDNLAIHEVSQADETGSDGGCNGDVVEYMPDVHLCIATIEPEGNHQTKCSAVRSQSGVARILPRAVGHLVHWHEHLNEMGTRREEIVGLIEQAVAQTGTHQNANEAIDEQRIEQFVLDFLVFIQPFHHEIAAHEAYEPAHAIPSQRDRTQVAHHFGGVPVDEE